MKADKTKPKEEKSYVRSNYSSKSNWHGGTASMGSPNQIVLAGWFLRFIGVAEVLGAIGLILPRLLHILRPGNLAKAT